MAIDPKELRRCLGHFTTGVTVIKFHHLGADHQPLPWGDSADGPEGQAWIPNRAAP